MNFSEDDAKGFYIQYRQIFNITRTKSLNLNVFHLV